MPYSTIIGHIVQRRECLSAFLGPKKETKKKKAKTWIRAVTAVYKGTTQKGLDVLLRSYDSRREPPPEFNCAIWQAGRATCAMGLAFKPIQIGQHMFTDEGPGTFNPSPLVLDEATTGEWPGREVGVFISIGTGKRPAGTNHRQHEWWEDFFSGTLGAFAEARRRLIDKIEDCENVHQYMLREHLAKRNVSRDNYFRLNVEVGVGEFGMNEWNRLADISTSTRRYLSKPEVKKSIISAGVKFAKIERMRRRFSTNRSAVGGIDTKVLDNNIDEDGMISPLVQQQQQQSTPTLSMSPPMEPDAVELPAEVPEEYIRRQQSMLSPTMSTFYQRPDYDDSLPAHPTPQEAILHIPYRHSFGEFPIHKGPHHHNNVYSHSAEAFDATTTSSSPPPLAGPPPVPPKTPIPYPENPDDVARVALPTMALPQLRIHSQGGVIPPYPMDEAPPAAPPIVNRQKKPSYHMR